MLLINLGAYEYTVELVERIELEDGRRCLGLTDPNTQHIRIDKTLKPAKRWNVFWHEWAEACAAEFDPHSAESMDLESMCNFVGLAMLHLTPAAYMRLWMYVHRGVIADDVLMVPGTPTPIPFFRSAGAVNPPSSP